MALQLFLLKAVGNNKQPSGENTVERLRLSKKNLQSNTPSHAFTAFYVLYQLENTKTQKITILWFQAWNMATRQNMFVEKFDSTCSIYSNPFLWYNSLTSLFGCLRLCVNYTVHIRQVPSASPTAHRCLPHVPEASTVFFGGDVDTYYTPQESDPVDFEVSSWEPKATINHWFPLRRPY